MKTADLLTVATYYVNPAVTDPNRLDAAIRTRFPRASVTVRIYDPSDNAIAQADEEMIATPPTSHLYDAHFQRVQRGLRSAFAEAAL